LLFLLLLVGGGGGGYPKKIRFMDLRGLELVLPNFQHVFSDIQARDQVLAQRHFL
jgi:hypothetical protein